ncbi:recombinase family protein [Azospirillum oryzae]|uniref:recombinase family protein n=1 Tax=Azospirillum oryzae TaxID=286727 RepID=UPI003CCFF4A3
MARSLSHLLEVIEGLETVGAHFKSLRDPIDTSTPQGKALLDRAERAGLVTPNGKTRRSHHNGAKRA